MEPSEYLARYIDSASCYYRNSGVGLTTSSALQSGSFELANSFPQEVRGPAIPANVFSTLIEGDEECEDYPDIFWLPFVSIKRPLHVPSKLDEFVVQRIIPYFNCQRKANHRQFAVVLLLSESDLTNIKQTRFSPSDAFGRPIIDNSFSLMPQDPSKYRNYIVARPSNKYHSEIKLFGEIDSSFNLLWRSYIKHNGAYPKCVLIYSWNLPCSHCTDVIIRSLGEKPYNRVSVVVAHTAVWCKETIWDHESNREKFKSKNIAVEQVPYPTHLQPVPSSM